VPGKLQFAVASDKKRVKKTSGKLKFAGHFKEILQ
jgi:hypothetical protein